MSRLCKKHPSLCTSNPLTDEEVCRKLALLRRIFASCFGPSGRLKQIHNNVGGHVLTTSTSTVLLKALTLSHPMLKLLSASVLNHVSRFSDCGLFTAILSSTLVENTKSLDIEPSLAIKVNRRLLDMCTSYLTKENCSCKVKVDFSSSHGLLVLAQSVITSKPACMLTRREAQHICSRVVQAFLRTVPCDTPGRVYLGKVVTVSVEGQPVEESAVFPGLLVDMPENLCLADVAKLGPGPFRVVVFNASLAGDLSETEEGALEVDGSACPEAAVLEQLLRLGEQVVADKVELFVCQRVVHPVLQQYLKRHGVIVVERLGISLLEPLLQVTGAQAVATFQAPVPVQSYGQVTGLVVRCCGMKEMLHLLPAGDSTHCTLMLCHRNETMLNEFRVVCQRADHVLRLTLKEPYALLGGGCTETHLAAYLRHKSGSDVSGAVSDLGCSRTDYLLATDGFCRSLESVARALEHDGRESLVDLSHGHRWAVPGDMEPKATWKDVVGSCGCGLISPSQDLEWAPLSAGCPPFSPVKTVNIATQPQVLDSFPAKRNALQVAVETANLILDLKYIIQDVN
ncbi:McKusick-Kaufman/Bardet-Biedl syndromes putative chaperonin [Megalops cyprinoides]|uniref:McKusick-Kaufman/Bardet-Biedl syndromes putative chaperonin n=1 Tax=Megalops cyprinoides TaxID=118141 RepID=UPI001864ACB0|nr:McKusick-Kaufman/Bardet-Biedl syndromes putative chaperonin [Megalops cyprinoides]